MTSVLDFTQEPALLAEYFVVVPIQRWVFVVALLMSARSFAQERNFDIEHLELAVGGGEFIATEGAGPLRPWAWRLGIGYRYSDSPLVVNDGVSTTRLIASRSLVDLTGNVQLCRWFGVGADVPLAIDGSGGIVPAGVGLGDLRIVPHVAILRAGHLGLAGLLGFRLPTGSTSRFLGEGMLVFEPRLAVEMSWRWLRAALNVGARFRESRRYLDLHIGQELLSAVAIAVVPKPWLTGFAELHADTALSSAFGQPQYTPVEALVGAAATYKGIRLGAALGIGLVRGYGESALRAIVTLEYRPRGGSD